MGEIVLSAFKFPKIIVGKFNFIATIENELYLHYHHRHYNANDEL